MDLLCFLRQNERLVPLATLHPRTLEHRFGRLTFFLRHKDFLAGILLCIKYLYKIIHIEKYG